MSSLVTNSQCDPYTNSRRQLIFYTTQIHFIIRHKPEGVWMQHTLNFFKPFVITELISQYRDLALKWNAPWTFILTWSILEQVPIWLVLFCLMITSQSYSLCLKHNLIFQHSYMFQTLTWTIIRQSHKNIFLKQTHIQNLYFFCKISQLRLFTFLFISFCSYCVLCFVKSLIIIKM